MFALTTLLKKSKLMISKQTVLADRLRNIESVFCNPIASANTAINTSLNIPIINNDFDEEVEEELKNLPLKDQQEMTNFEKRLRDPDFKRKVIFYLGKIGGGNLHVVTVNLLKKLLSNAVASEYSLLGKKRKKIFKNTAVFSVIVRVIQTNDPTATEDKINEVIAKWLAQASFRLEREKERRPFTFTTLQKP